MLADCDRLRDGGEHRMTNKPNISDRLPLGIILRKQPGLTRWAKWHWTVATVVPGAAQTNWREIRRDGDRVDYLAGAIDLVLYKSDTDAYVHELNARTPSVYIILRETGTTPPFDIIAATASPYEAQDYADNGEDIVEKVAMPDELTDWVKAFLDQFHSEEPFIKRKRDRLNIDKTEDGIGDPRVHKTGDIYASPAMKRERLQ